MFIVAGTLKNRKIRTPKGAETRPTTGKLRESLFNICQAYIGESRFLDLFAGSGAIGIEALSRGAESATFIDNNRESIRCIQENIANLKLEELSQVLFGDVFSQLAKLEKLKKQYEIIYADAPYESPKSPEDSITKRLLDYIDSGTLLAPSGMLFIEERWGPEPPQENLRTLTLMSSRRLGKSALHQYQKQDNR